MPRDREFFKSPKLHLAVIGVLSACILFGNLHIGGLSGYDDAIFAYESRQMVTSSDWWKISANGYPHFDYLPLFYWMQALSMSLLGFSDFAAKFPAAICGLILILLTYFIAFELFADTITAIMSAWVLMLTQYFMKYATHGMSDIPFALFFASALFFYLKGCKNKPYFFLFGLAVAFSVMTRTVLGFIPLVIALAHLISTRRARLMRTKEFIAAVVIAIAIPGLCYLKYYAMFGLPFLEGHFSFIWTKTVSGEGFDILQFLQGLLEYPFLLIKLYQPWLLFAMVGLVWEVRRAIRTRDERSIFLVIWVFAVIAPFSFASAKVLRYIMPVFPAFAILAAIPLSLWVPRLIKERYQRLAFAGLCLIVLTIPFLSRPKFRAESVTKIAPVIVSNSEATRRVVLYTGGVLHHDVLNQMIWYTSRYYDHVGELNELQKRLQTGEPTTFVVDRQTFDTFIIRSDTRLEVAGSTDAYVCFRTV